MSNRNDTLVTLNAIARATASLIEAVEKASPNTMILVDGAESDLHDVYELVVDWNKGIRAEARANFRTANNCDAGDSMMTDPEANR